MKAVKAVYFIFKTVIIQKCETFFIDDFLNKVLSIKLIRFSSILYFHMLLFNVFEIEVISVYFAVLFFTCGIIYLQKYEISKKKPKKQSWPP